MFTRLIKQFVLITICYFCLFDAIGQTTVTIGTGTSIGRYPLDDYYVYSCSQCLYLSSEIGSSGTITKLRWYRDDTGADPTAIGTTEIWLHETTNSSLTGTTWENPGTLVATISDIDLGSGDEWFEIDISDFIYSGTNNLLVSVRTQDAPYTAPHSYWRYTSTSSTYLSRLGQSDGTNPPSMSLSYNRPNIQFDLEALPSFMPPTNLTSTNILANSATVNWTASTSNPSDGYDIYYSTSSITPISGTTPSASVLAGVTTYNMSSLSSNTTYYVWVRANCGSSDYSVWIGPCEFTTPLSGTYTINSAQATGGTNFNSFSDFASVVNSGGVYSSTIINVTEGSGPYNEQVFLNEIPNISETKTLTINGNDEILQYSSSNSNERATLKLDGTKYTTFNNLIVKSQGTYGFTVQLMNEADFNTFDNCEFYASTSSTTSAHAAFIASNNATTINSPGDMSASNLTISNCKIVGGFAGIALNGPSSLSKLSCPQNNQILNNEILNFYTTGVYIRNYQENLIISGNTLSRPDRTNISTSNQLDNFAGLCVIGMKYGSFNCEITKNHIYDLIDSGSTSSSSTITKGIYVEDINNGLLISNNLIYGFDGVEGVQYGIDMKTETGELSKIYHNTVFLDNTSHGNAKIVSVFNHLGDGDFDIRNNIFGYTTNSTADKVTMDFSSGTGTITSDYNILYLGTSDANSYTCALGFTDYSTLADWQAVNSSSYDQNSNDCNPNFTSPLLTPSNSLLSNMGVDLTAVISDDIFGYGRPSTPTPGAIEMNPTTLPIELKGFKGECKEQYINVKWETLSETNNDYFILEKSNGKNEFFEIARLDGAGNSNSVKDYQFIDNKLFDGDNYYRLKQVDFDGRINLCDIVSLNCDKEDAIKPVLYAYPNPFNNELNVVIENVGDDVFVLELFDDLGRLVYMKEYKSSSKQFKTVITLDHLKPAVYNLRSVSDDNIMNVRVVKK